MGYHFIDKTSKEILSNQGHGNSFGGNGFLATLKILSKKPKKKLFYDNMYVIKTLQ
jgi:hypothetical protein